MTVAISSTVLSAIRDEAASAPDREVCGLLFGRDGAVASHSTCRNVSATPADRFEIDPAALIAAYRAERGGGATIAGCYHSHPSGSTVPSRRDAAAAQANGWLWVIVAGATVGVWQAVKHGAVHGRFEAVEYRVAPDG